MADLIVLGYHSSGKRKNSKDGLKELRGEHNYVV